MLLEISLANCGCVAIRAGGALTGATQYVKYTIDNIANQTFSGNLDRVTKAPLVVLKKMRIQIDTVKTQNESAKIHAYTNDLSMWISASMFVLDKENHEGRFKGHYLVGPEILSDQHSAVQTAQFS